MNERVGAQDLLDQLFHGLRDGVLIADRNAKILYINPAAEKLLATSAQQACGQSACELLCGRMAFPNCPTCQERCGLRAGKESGATLIGSRDESRFTWRAWDVKRLPRFRDLRVRCLRMSTPLFGDETQDEYFTLIEEAVEDVQLARVKEEWRDMVAHDVRAPLANVYATLRILEDRKPGGPIEPSEARLVAGSAASCRRLLEVVNLYMDILRLETGMMTVRTEELALRPLIAGCLQRQAGPARQRRIEVSADVDATLAVLADPEILAHVVDNILDNAIKFAPPGGRVSIAGRRHGAFVEISIKDTGPGMDRETVGQLFDRRFQARARQEGRIKGNGLGLAYCKEALAAMRCEIAVDSSPGAGADFVLHCPDAQS